MMRQLKIILALLGTLFTLHVQALGLSHIQVSSALNERLNAKINVLSIPKGSVSTIRVSLASAQAFRRAGIERPYVLTLLEFAVQPTGKTSAIIEVTTQQPFTEPYINFLVEVSWPGGRILREYTALLDPPLYATEASQAPIQVASLDSTTTRTMVPAQRPMSQPRAFETTAFETTTFETTATTSEVRSYATSQPVTSPTPTRRGFYTIVRNDTSWRIAHRTRPTGVSIHRHMRNI